MLKGIVFFLTLCVILLFGFSQADSVLSLIDLSSFYITVLGALFLLYISFPWAVIGKGFGFIFSGQKEFSRASYLELSCLYRTAGDNFLYCGVLGTLIGFVLMLSNLKDSSTLGPNLSVSLITFFYGITGWLLSLALRHKLDTCQTSDEPHRLKPHKLSMAFPAGLLVFLAINVLFFLQVASLLVAVDVPSMIIVLAGTVIGGLLFCSPLGLGKALKLAFTNEELTIEDGVHGLTVFAQLNDIVASLVVIASIAPLIAMLGEFPAPSSAGPKAALAWISLYYGIILLCLIRGLSSALERRLSSNGEEVEFKPFFSSIFMLWYSLLVSAVIWTLLLLMIK